jgi:hypothetical protein
MRTLTLVIVISGCTPIIPFHLAETAETMPRGAVSLTLAGGGGAGTLQTGYGGGSARVSVGVGHKMEVGVETSLVGTPASHSLEVLAKLRYKYGFHPNVALLAGIGATGNVDTSTGSGTAGIGGDVGLVASTRPFHDVLRLYGGARFSFVFAAHRDPYDGGGPTQAFIVPVGLAFQTRPTWRIYLEGGLFGGFSEYRVADLRDLGKWIGGYGLVAIAHHWY